ncbi:zinc-ribbon domain-containing protein [Maridesulfovibrio bastinii]|uniref:zinc-ribbon domain-containing protein n=1 Tax=Maridesulfovibrio bastinii TaxID=47157 RepID=UPI00042A4CBE|nr:zinc-ribbon domain-containing protein [Maridesulfovibrio bastinii]
MSESKRCHKCGTENLLKAKRCYNCGSKLSMGANILYLVKMGVILAVIYAVSKLVMN